MDTHGAIHELKVRQGPGGVHAKKCNTTMRLRRSFKGFTMPGSISHLSLNSAIERCLLWIRRRSNV